MMKNLFLACLCMLTLQMTDVTAQPLPSQVRMVNGADVSLTDSWLSKREALNTQYMMSLGTDRLLHNFRLTAGIASTATPLGGWEDPGCGLRGHFTGHYLSALSTLVQRYHDAEAEQKLKELVDGLAECQSKFANGYLGAIQESDFETLEKTYGNVWAPYYTLHKIMQGLVDAYVKTGNEKALEVACKAADYVYGRLSKLSAETLEGMFRTDQANPGNEHGGMNEVLEQLYSITKNENYLAAAQLFDRDWFVTPLAEHRDNLSGLHSNTHIVLIGGFVRRYENTGEERFRKAALNFWDILSAGHVYANGTSSGPRPVATTATSRTAEHWGDSCKLANTLSGEIAESCVTHNTQRINNYLFQWMADAKYADAAMNTFYNGTLACQNAYDGRVTYHMPLGSPRHKSWLGKEDFRCCNGSSIEAFANLNSNIYYVSDTAVYVNNYVPSVMKWSERGVSLTQTGGFPFSPTATITLNCTSDTHFALNLLIPSWATQVEATINGQPVDVEIRAGSFLSLPRDWKDGDQVNLTFEYPFYLKAMPDDADRVVLFHGPLMLAFVGNETIELPETTEQLLSSISGNPTEGYTLKSALGDYRLKPLCNIIDENYSCYFKKGVTNSVKMRSIDNVIIGNSESESSHALAHSSGSNTGSYNSRNYRDAEKSGYVQYTLHNTSQSTDSVSLMLCFTLADKGRMATAYIDGVKVADIAVPEAIKGADEKGFYNIEYPIPASLLTEADGSVKRELVFKIMASSTTQIPGLYDVRLLSGYQSRAYRFRATDWITGDAGRVAQSQIDYDTEANTITMTGATGKNNVCLMLDTETTDYTVNADLQYLIVWGDNISTVAANSNLWWLNGVCDGTSVAANYHKKLDNGDVLIGWKLSSSGIDRNYRGDQCPISSGNTIFGVTSVTGSPVIKYIGFVTSPADFIATTDVENVIPTTSSPDSVYNLQGQLISATHNHTVAHGVYISVDAQGNTHKVILGK